MRDDNDKKKRKLDFFMENETLVHIRLSNGRFLNGLVIEKERDGIYILKERKLGLIHLFVEDIFEVDEFLEVGK